MAKKNEVTTDVSNEVAPVNAVKLYSIDLKTALSYKTPLIDHVFIKGSPLVTQDKDLVEMCSLDDTFVVKELN